MCAVIKPRGREKYEALFRHRNTAVQQRASVCDQGVSVDDLRLYFYGVVLSL